MVTVKKVDGMWTATIMNTIKISDMSLINLLLQVEELIYEE